MKQQKTRKKSKNKSREIKNLKKSFHSGLYIQDNKRRDKPINETLLSIYNALSKCGFSYLLQKCFNCLTEFATKLFCNREYCLNPECQEASHKRRMGRKWLKFLKMGDEIGYIVFTIPKSRIWTRKDLKKIRDYIKNMLKNHLTSDLLALVRWHWFGDGFYICNSYKYCKYKGISKRLKGKITCENFYTSCKHKQKIINPYFPHLNILMNVAYILPSELNKIKLLYRRWLNRTFNLDISTVNVWYNYSSESKKKLHWFSYIYRNTMRILQGNETLAIELKGFRNDVTWGNFKDISYKIPKAYAKFQKEIIPNEVLKLWGGKCLECGKRDIRTMKGIYYIYDISKWNHIGLKIYKRVIQKNIDLKNKK